jgi:hypothetical protein
MMSLAPDRQNEGLAEHKLANYLKLGSKGVVSFAVCCFERIVKEDTLHFLHAYTHLGFLSKPVGPVWL